MTEAHWLKKIALTHPKAPALAHGQEVVCDFANMADDAGQLAGGLLEADLSSGDRIAIFAANTPSYITALYGIWWAGLVAVPINAKLHQDEVAFILDHAEIKMIFVIKETRSVAEKAISQCGHDVVVISLEWQNLKGNPIEPHHADADDLAWLFYTSGTTGRPKGAMLTFRNLDEMSRQFLQCVADVSLGDAIIHAAPLSHGSGLYALPHLRVGACQVIPKSGGFDGEEIATLLDRWTGVAMFAAPTMVNRLVRSDVDLTAQRLTQLKVIVYGGAPMYAEDAEAALARWDQNWHKFMAKGKAP